jgi:MFS family permease
VTGRAAEKRALLLGFLVFGGFWGAWSALLPDVQRLAGVDDTGLGLALGAIAVAALPAMPLAGRLVDRLGPATILPRSLLAFAIVCPLPGLVDGPLGLVLALLALGLTTGVLDVVLNTATAAWERVEAGRLMTAGHGFFSLGVLVGSISTGVARDLGATPFPVLLVVTASLVAVAAVQPAYRRAPASFAAPGASRRLPPLLLLLGVLIAGSFLVEDGLTSWSALHLERGLAAPPWVGGLGPGVFAAFMTLGRFGAHALIKPGRDPLVVGGGGALVGVGTLLLAVAGTPAVGLVGLALAGLGTSVLAPTLFSAVGERSAPGRQGADLARVTALGYAGFVAGPPLVGLVSGATSLPFALAMLAVVGVLVAVGGPVLLRAGRPAPAGARGR